MLSSSLSMTAISPRRQEMTQDSVSRRAISSGGSFGYFIKSNKKEKLVKLNG
jgi:hypothetical protein